MKRNLVLMIIILFVVSGCGAAGGVKQNVVLQYQPDLNIKFRYSLSPNQLIEVPSEVLENMRTQLNEKLSERNLLATQDKSKFSEVAILITEYRMRSGATRILFGMMSGCDIIKTKVTIMNVDNGKVMGESHFESTNCLDLPTSAGIIRQHINKIAGYLSGK